MNKNKIKTNMKIDENVLKKIAVIAKFNNRSLNAQLEHLIKKRINEYEKQNGAINI
ncbi:MAG: hypothetical protein FWF92_07945 [Oscillospiraceae bacterium]|nr:hypothetical protein [Oscillospiraceae bacterium]